MALKLWLVVKMLGPWRATQETEGTGSRLFSSVRRAASGRQAAKEQGREQGPGSFS